MERAQRILQKMMPGLHRTLGVTCSLCGGSGQHGGAGCPRCSGFGTEIPPENSLVLMFSLASAYIGAARGALERLAPDEAAEYLDFFTALHRDTVERSLAIMEPAERERSRQYMESLLTGIAPPRPDTTTINGTRAGTSGTALSPEELEALGITLDGPDE